MESLNPTRFLENPRRKKEETLAFAACTTMYNILPQNAGRSADWCTVGLKKGH